MRERTFVTGFGAFAGVEVNPSALLAQSLDRPFQLLEVSYRAVDEWIDSTRPTFDRLLMLGVRRSGTRIDVERRARNEISALPDVRGEVRGPAPIDADAPAELMTTLFDEATTESFSDDAGCYLCNYVYFRALRAFPAQHVGFVHVPPFVFIPFERQRQFLLELLASCENR